MTETGLDAFSIVAAHLDDDIRGLQSDRLIVVSLRFLLYCREGRSHTGG